MVVFFDIDGTIVDERTQVIPASAVRAIQKLRDNGHIPVINTGRPYSHIDPRVRQLPFSGWVCAGGMQVYAAGQWLLREHLGPDLSQQVIEAARQCRMQVIYEAEGGFLLDPDFSSDSRIALESRRVQERGCFIRPLTQPAEIIKFVTFDGPDCRREEFLHRMAADLTCIQRGGTMVEYVKKGCSKAAGMERLLRHLGIPREQALAIGDSTNDIPMFRAAGHGVCMGGGMEEAKAQADFVTAPVLEDGIELALIHYDLIEK